MKSLGHLLGVSVSHENLIAGLGTAVTPLHSILLILDDTFGKIVPLSL